MNSLSWCVIVLNCVRSEGIREREVLSTTKLKPDVDGHAKTGVNVGGAVIIAVDDFDVPVGNIDYCCTDTTSSNSSLNLMTLRGSARQTAERSQRRIARQLRDALRTLLRSAAQKGALPWGTVLKHHRDNP